jgi:hypothetical protein
MADMPPYTLAALERMAAMISSITGNFLGLRDALSLSINI